MSERGLLSDAPAPDPHAPAPVGKPGLRPAHILVPLGAALSLFPFVSAAAALVAGIVIALVAGNPYVGLSRKLTHPLLAWSVIGMGAAMNLGVMARVGAHGALYTAVGIVTALTLGLLLAKGMRVPQKTGLLISVGTAICGGSAIAAVVPIIRANEEEASVALGTVFLLNAVALVVFPPLGHAVGLDQQQFGLWSALAIHDTSSVVGAAMQYGPHALEVATTTKLARALWIIPVSVGVGMWFSRKHAEGAGAKAKKPWFILGFILAAALVTFVPALAPAGHVVARVARQGLVLTLFLIGVSLTAKTLRSVGLRPFGQGVVLWLAMGSLSLGAILLKLIA